MYDIFDKLIRPILSYEVWGFIQGTFIEVMQALLGVKQTTENYFVDGEFVQRHRRVVKCWLKYMYKDML